MTDEQLDALLEIFQKRMQRVTDEYLTAMGEQVKEIGRVIPSAETRLIQMRRMRMNVRRVQSKIAAASGEAVEDIARVFEVISKDNARFAEAFSDNPDIAFLSQPLLAQIKATAGEMANLSRTTIDSTLYRDVIDRGIQAAQSGVEDYNSAIRRALREASAEGIRVTYASGHTRRLDTAVRQNVLDGIRKLNQANMEAIGEKFGADGVEISAHMMCAEDHLPYQGKQYSNEEFARIQAALKRPFGEWNCRHSWSPIILGISRPAYTDEELRQFAQNSTEKITIDGKTKTRYEWTQEQRKVETAIRYQQDIATAAKASGDTELRRESRRNISALNDYYRKISDAANVPSRPERMGTYYGRTAVLRSKASDGMDRRTGNYGPFTVLPERMSKKRVREIASEYGVSLKGITIVIDMDAEKLSEFFPYAGRADTQQIGRIDFFPNAFRSKEELTRTLFHEKMHIEQFKEYGMEYVSNNRIFFEELAEKLENEFIANLKKEGRL